VSLPSNPQVVPHLRTGTQVSESSLDFLTAWDATNESKVLTAMVSSKSHHFLTVAEQLSHQQMDSDFRNFFEFVTVYDATRESEALGCDGTPQKTVDL
jgi:hypothetical protein